VFRHTACPLTGSRGRTPRACSRGRGARESCLPVQRPLPQTASRKPRARRAHTSVPPLLPCFWCAYMCTCSKRCVLKRTHFCQRPQTGRQTGASGQMAEVCVFVAGPPARCQRNCRAGAPLQVFCGPRTEGPRTARFVCVCVCVCVCVDVHCCMAVCRSAPGSDCAGGSACGHLLSLNPNP